jgi:cell division protein FtsW
MLNAGAYFRSWFARFEAVSIRRPDPWLWLPAGALLMLGLMMVLNTTYFMGVDRSASFFYFKRQLGNIAVGLIAMGLLSQFSLRGLRRLTTPLMIAAALTMIALWIPGLGAVRGGARRWLMLGHFGIEPSELVKFAVVFFLARMLSGRQERMASFAQGPLPAMLVIAPLAILVLKQPDFGATVMLSLMLFAMLFAAGARPAHIAGAGGAALILLAIQAGHKAYRMRRLATFLDPWRTARGAGFQLIQSFIALGAGGKWGVGLGAGRQKMFYLPQAHTDFVFAVVGEEFGIVGAFVVIGLFCVILMRGMRIAHDDPDPFASLLATGLTALLSLQALINMAVVIGLVPTKGLPLPFLSYGGTAMVISLATLGVLLALARRPAAASKAR